MIRVSDVFILGRDFKALQRRVDYLTKEVDKIPAGSPVGYRGAELGALKRLLSQVREKGKPCEPGTAEVTAGVEVVKGWRIGYAGGSFSLPWRAKKVEGRVEGREYPVLSGATLDECRDQIEGYEQTLGVL